MFRTVVQSTIRAPGNSLEPHAHGPQTAPLTRTFDFDPDLHETRVSFAHRYSKLEDCRLSPLFGLFTDLHETIDVVDRDQENNVTNCPT